MPLRYLLGLVKHNFETCRASHFAKMSLLDSTNLPRKTASATSATAVSHSVKTSNTVITTTSDKENIKPSPNQQPTNLSNGNDLADFLQDICWEETWQLDGTATSVDAQEPVQQWCEDDALLYWIEEFNKPEMTNQLYRLSNASSSQSQSILYYVDL